MFVRSSSVEAVGPQRSRYSERPTQSVQRSQGKNEDEETEEYDAVLRHAAIVARPQRGNAPREIAGDHCRQVLAVTSGGRISSSPTPQQASRELAASNREFPPWRAAPEVV
jgi:hypothetical protein